MSSLRSWEDAKGDHELEADVAIVGTGPGGAAIGRVLAEAGKRVVFLEEGPARPVFRPNMAHTMRYHMQENGAMIALGAAAVNVAAGRGVGGGSLINSAICWRTPDHVLDGWVDVLGGDDRFSVANMAPVYDEIEQIIEVTRTSEAIAGQNNKLIVRGAKKLGLPGGLLNRNTPRCVGCGICNWGCPSGGKASVDTNLLQRAMAAGAIIQADTYVTRVRHSGGKVTGVAGIVRHQDTRQRVGTVTVHADTVVLAAGAVGTPRLLHQTDLADTLGDRVGKGLHLHPGNAVLGLCDFEVRMWTGATQGAYFEDPELPGVLPHTLSMPPGALLLTMGGVGPEARANIQKAPYMAGCVVMISDKGEGEVGIKSDGRADITYWFEPEDEENLRKGMRRTAEVLVAGGVKKLLIPIAGVGFVDTIDEAFAAIDAAKITDYTAMYAAHPMATCRMGTSIENSVIGPDGQAHGLKNLYIADGSIFPTSLGVNPQLTIMTMATVIGRHMVGGA